MTASQDTHDHADLNPCLTDVHFMYIYMQAIKLKPLDITNIFLDMHAACVLMILRMYVCYVEHESLIWKGMYLSRTTLQS